MKLVTLTLPTNYDIHLFHEGNLFKSYNVFGSHISTENGVSGTRFCVWAPNAIEVRVVGNFNNWSGSKNGLTKINTEGIWSGFFPDLGEGELYKYEIFTETNEIILKSDPYAFFSEVRPNTASIVYNPSGYNWNDQKWQKQKNPLYDKPLFIYELHLGSWRVKEDGSLYTYSELAQELIPYVIEHGFTHIELLPLIEHPLDISWGYQGTGYYSATSRFGTPHELMYFIDQCHQNGIGVIMDWVPGHFCKDAHGLYMFDGQPTYEYSNENDRENRVWGTANFDLGKPEVQSYLISNAIYWLEYFHIDGFRVDAVANMLYWPNQGDQLSENPYAVAFLQKLNNAVESFDSSVIMIAEDSTDWPLVTTSPVSGGLGFNYKWNMGWMNDILKYMEADPKDRIHLHNKITFSFLYAFSENYILPFSHDEVVHGKKSLLNKMPGDYWRKFAQLRLLYGFFVSHPGKKLLFMGGEFGQFAEWKDKEQLDWNLDDFDMHQKTRTYVKDLVKVYKKYKPLHELDRSTEGFDWIDANNNQQQIVPFIRKSKGKDDFLVIVCNFSETVYHDYKIGVVKDTRYIEVFNSDNEIYGGSNQINKKQIQAIEQPLHDKPYHISITIPPFGISILRPVKKRGESLKNGTKKMRSNVIGRRKR